MFFLFPFCVFKGLQCFKGNVSRDGLGIFWHVWYSRAWKRVAAGPYMSKKGQTISLNNKRRRRRGNLPCILILMIFSGHELFFLWILSEQVVKTWIFFSKPNIFSACCITGFRTGWTSGWKSGNSWAYSCSSLHASTWVRSSSLCIPCRNSKKTINVVFVLIA